MLSTWMLYEFWYEWVMHTNCWIEMRTIEGHMMVCRKIFKSKILWFKSAEQLLILYPAQILLFNVSSYFLPALLALELIYAMNLADKICMLFDAFIQIYKSLINHQRSNQIPNHFFFVHFGFKNWIDYTKNKN